MPHTPRGCTQPTKLPRIGRDPALSLTSSSEAFRTHSESTQIALRELYVLTMKEQKYSDIVPVSYSHWLSH